MPTKWALVTVLVPSLVRQLDYRTIPFADADIHYRIFKVRGFVRLANYPGTAASPAAAATQVIMNRVLSFTVVSFVYALLVEVGVEYQPLWAGELLIWSATALAIGWTWNLKLSEADFRSPTVARIGLTVGLCLSALVFSRQPWLQSRQASQLAQQAKLEANPATLEADDEPAPMHGCRGPGDATVYLGSSFQGSRNFPFSVIVAHHRPVLVVDRDASGGLVVTFDVRDVYGHLMATIVKNQVTVLPMNGYIVPRKTLHDLTVLDSFGNQVLNIHYINKNNLRFTGEINIEGLHLFVGQNEMVLNGNVTSELDGCDNFIGYQIGY